MKKLSFLMLACVLTLAAQAKVWRLNNNTGVSTNFTSFTTAQTGAANGDTIYVEGSQTSYGDITISKALVIIGTGYFLTENPQTQANLNPATFGNVTFNTGSSNSVITGLTLTGDIEIKVGNITVKRNLLNGININSTNSFGNILITQNYIYGGISNNTGSANIYNVIISNNYVQLCCRWGFSFGTNYSGTISNNVLFGVGVYNFVFTNNILEYNGVDLNNNTFFNNICDGTQFPTGNGNQQNITMTDVYVGATGTSDGQWQLKSGSPAIAAGNDGKDCGMFGGVTPYVLSGMPEIPAVYYINMPATGTSNNGINVTVKAKTH